jgi:hypothetical protein
MKGKNCLYFIPSNMVGVLLKVRTARVSFPIVTVDETQAVLTFNKTPTMLLGLKHKPFLPSIRHPPCYWGWNTSSSYLLWDTHHVTGDERQAVLAFNKTPTMLKGKNWLCSIPSNMVGFLWKVRTACVSSPVVSGFSVAHLFGFLCGSNPRSTACKASTLTIKSPIRLFSELNNNQIR